MKTSTDPPASRVRPAQPEEAGAFFAQTPEQDAQMGAIGHVRMDFGGSGKEFWHSWHPRGREELNSPEFKAELQRVVDTLRETVLKDLSSMQRFCSENGGDISGGWSQNYGYVVETEHYEYCLRCNPVKGDYQAYLSCYDLNEQKINHAYPFCSSRNGRLRFCHTSLLQLPQSRVDPGERLHSRIQIGELHFAHVRQHCQLVEIVADGFLLPQDFFQSIENHDTFSETTRGHIVALAHMGLCCFPAYRFQILCCYSDAELFVFFHVSSVSVEVGVGFCPQTAFGRKSGVRRLAKCDAGSSQTGNVINLSPSFQSVKKRA